MYQTDSRKAIRCAFSVDPAIPANDILLPGRYLPGLLMYPQMNLLLQVIPEFFMALLYEKAVVPAFLPITPPKGGAAAPLPSP